MNRPREEPTPFSNRRGFLSFRFELFLVIGILVTGLALFIYIYFPAKIGHAARETLVGEYRMRGEVLAKALGEPLSAGDLDAAREMIATLTLGHEIECLLLRDEADRHLGSTGDQCTFETDQAYWIDDERDRLLTRSEIERSDRALGTLWIGFSLEQTNRVREAQREVAGMAAIFVFAVGMMAAFWIASAMSKPIRTLHALSLSPEHNPDRRIAGGLELVDIRHALEERLRNPVLPEASEERPTIAAPTEPPSETAASGKDLTDLRLRCDQLERCFELTDAVTLLLNRDGRVLEVNRAGRRLLRIPEAVPSGDIWFQDLVPSEDRDRARVEIGTLFRVPDKQSSSAEYSLIGSDGERRQLAFHDVLLRGDDDRPVLLFRTGRDITRLRALESHLRASQRMETVATLVSGLAHDFNNVLTSIIWCGQLALNEPDSAEVVTETQREILEAAEHAKGLTRQILTFSGRREVEHEPLPFAETVRETLSLVRTSLPSRVRIDADIPEDDAVIMGDVTRLQQVLINLGSNAAHAMKDGNGTLFITTDRQGDEVALIVEDTGTGMEESIKSRIFEPFFTTKPEGTGMGLGLSVVREVVESHGGRIGVRSRPGVGTRFEIFLPVHASEPVRNRDEGDTPTEGEEHVLLVDDEEMITRVAGDALGHFGYRVTRFNSAVEALAFFEDHPSAVDIIVTDIIIPEMSGWQLAERARTIRPAVPIVFVTGCSQDGIAREMGEMSDATLLMKPFTPSELARCMRGLLESIERTAPPKH